MKFYLIYGVLVLFRFIIHVNKQPGYIHPDEFFQTIEISAGDVLKYEIFKPWEFDAASPIRSKAIIELFLNVPLKLYLQFRQILTPLVNFPFDLLTFCRLWTTFCSLIVDYSIYVKCKHFQINYKSALFLHSISYISMVFLSRSFSNVWETQLLSLFVIVMIKIRGNSSEILQGVIIALGVFCRPTFLVFVLPHVVLQIVHLDLKRVCYYGINGLVGFLSVAVVLIGFDTAKYGSGVVSISDVVVVPVNFIKYNANATNLEQHGRHPWFLHAGVNVPLLLGPLVIPIISALGPIVGAHKQLLACVLAPIAFLSLFPHQEMRFLLPVYPVAVLLAVATMKGQCFTKLILVLHVVFNLLSIVFWGYLHQGALLGATSIAHRHMTARTSGKICHLVVTYKSMMLPKFPFAIEQHSARACNDSVHNLVGLDESQFWERVVQLKRQTTSPAALHLIYPKAYQFKERENFKKLGEIKSIYTIPGHINTDLWPPGASIYDFLCLQYIMFSF